MITKSQRKAFKKVLGRHYTSKVIEVLKEEGVKDSSGKTHSAVMIVQVFNNNRNHAAIENAILKAVEIQLQEDKKQERKKEKLLKSIES